MRGLLAKTVATAMILFSGSMAMPTTKSRGVTIVHPGGIHDLIITESNTVNSTNPKGGVKVVQGAAAGSLTVTLSNNYGGGAMNAYVTGTEISTGKVVMLSTSGEWYYPDAQGSATPVAIPSSANVAIPLNGQGQKTTFTLPDYLDAGRVWISAGELHFYVLESGGITSLVQPSPQNPSDPSSGIVWGFIELTNKSAGIWANLTFVDFVGLALGMTLTLGSGSTQTVQTVKGLKPGSVASICSDMRTQAASDGQPWDKMCMTDSNGNALRVMSPNLWLSTNPGQLDSYWDPYIQSVWSTYTNQDLVFNLQDSDGTAACRVTSGTLNCKGDNRGYAQPTAADIAGCNSGPFAIASGDNSVHQAIVPRLCAAFTRSTLLLDNGQDTQPGVSASRYYSVNPTDHYARILHNYEIDGRGYAFSYDDVNPDSASQDSEGLLSGPNPTSLYITVGGPDS